jgi:hypothetical protein
MTSAKANPELALLLQIIDQAYDRPAWHGTNLRGSLRGVTTGEAAWRPAPGRHNIWEIMMHAAYWKYAVRRRLLGEKRGSFPRHGSNWFARPGNVAENAWQKDLALLGEMHRNLREAIVELPAKRLFRPAAGSKHSHAVLIYGVASHDLYHAGQIQLLKRLYSTEAEA